MSIWIVTAAYVGMSEDGDAGACHFLGFPDRLSSWKPIKQR
jgi:hypothetical protein